VEELSLHLKTANLTEFMPLVFFSLDPPHQPTIGSKHFTLPS